MHKPTHSLIRSFVRSFIHMSSAFWRVPLHLDYARYLEPRDKLAMGLALEGLSGNTENTQWERQTHNNSNGSSDSSLCLLSVYRVRALTHIILLITP